MSRLAIDLESAARDAAGNWQQFGSFSWHRAWDLDDADQWTICYTHDRDSGLLAQSNADAIAAEMEPFQEGDDPDCIAEHHSHWACGWVDGYAIRVYRPDGSITPAFERWCELAERLQDYPVLDEDDYSRREYEQTLENIHDVGEDVARDHDYELPDGWESAVFSWLWEHDQSELDSHDDRGGYPSEESIRDAFDGLGYPCLSDDDESEDEDSEDENPRIIPAPGQFDLPFGD